MSHSVLSLQFFSHSSVPERAKRLITLLSAAAGGRRKLRGGFYLRCSLALRGCGQVFISGVTLFVRLRSWDRDVVVLATRWGHTQGNLSFSLGVMFLFLAVLLILGAVPVVVMKCHQRKGYVVHKMSP